MRGRRLISIILASLLSVGLVSGIASGEPQEGDVVASGQILVGNPAFEPLGRLLYGDPSEFDGPHAFRFDAAGLDGLWLWPQVHDPTGAGFVVGIHYMDDEGRFMDTDCSDGPGSTALATEPYGELGVMIQCLVPEGARTGYVYAWVGALLDITVVVSSAPEPLPAGVLASGTVAIGTPHGDISWWAMFGSSVASPFAVRANVTGLDGARIVTDVTDNGVLGHDVRFTFRSTTGGFLDAECTPMPGAVHPLETGGTEIRWSESCIVPPGAIVLDAALQYGTVVHITLRTV